MRDELPGTAGVVKEDDASGLQRRGILMVEQEDVPDMDGRLHRATDHDGRSPAQGFGQQRRPDQQDADTDQVGERRGAQQFPCQAS